MKVYPDKFAQREIGQYVVECEYKENGCVWWNRIKDLEVIILSQIDSREFGLLFFKNYYSFADNMTQCDQIIGFNIAN